MREEQIEKALGRYKNASKGSATELFWFNEIKRLTTSLPSGVSEEKCVQCGGTGIIKDGQYSEDCMKCYGSGYGDGTSTYPYAHPTPAPQRQEIEEVERIKERAKAYIDENCKGMLYEEMVAAYNAYKAALSQSPKPSEITVDEIKQAIAGKCHNDEAAQEAAKAIHDLIGEKGGEWIRPTDSQVIDICILFNDGKLEAEKLADMVAPIDFILDRLFENGDVTIPSSKEVSPPKQEKG